MGKVRICVYGDLRFVGRGCGVLRWVPRLNHGGCYWLTSTLVEAVKAGKEVWEAPGPFVLLVNFQLRRSMPKRGQLWEGAPATTRKNSSAGTQFTVGSIPRLVLGFVRRLIVGAEALAEVKPTLKGNRLQIHPRVTSRPAASTT